MALDFCFGSARKDEDAASRFSDIFFDKLDFDKAYQANEFIEMMRGVISDFKQEYEVDKIKDNGLRKRLSHTLYEQIDCDYTDSYLNEEYFHLMLFPPVGSTNETISENDIYTGSLRLGSVFKNTPRRSLNDESVMYGSLVLPRLIMQRQFNSVIENSIMLDNGRAIRTNERWLYLFREKMKLAKNILDVIDDGKTTTVGDEQVSAGTIKTWVNDLLNVLNDSSISYKDKLDYVMGKTESRYAISNITELYNKQYGEIMKESDLLRMANSTSRDDEKRILAYNSLFLIRNVDYMIMDKFRDFINIPSAGTDLLQLIDVEAVNKTNMHKGWQDEKDEVSAWEEVDGINRILIDTIPYYDGKVKTQVMLGNNRFNNIMGFLHNLNNLLSPNMYIYKQDGYGGLIRVNDMSLYDMMSKWDLNRGEMMFKLFSYLFPANGDTYYLMEEIDNGRGGKSLIQVGTTKQDATLIDSMIGLLNLNEYEDSYKRELENSLYSVYMRLYDAETGLYNAAMDAYGNPDIPNYYETLCKYMVGMYRNQFLQYKYDTTTHSYRLFDISKRPTTLAESAVKSSIYNSSSSIYNMFTRYQETFNRDDNTTFSMSVGKEQIENRDGSTEMHYVVYMRNMAFTDKNGNTKFVNIKYDLKTDKLSTYTGNESLSLILSSQSRDSLSREMSILFRQNFDKDERLRNKMPEGESFKQMYMDGLRILAMSKLNENLENGIITDDNTEDPGNKAPNTRTKFRNFIRENIAKAKSGNDGNRKPIYNMMFDSLKFDVISNNMSNTINTIVTAIATNGNMMSRNTVRLSDNTSRPLVGSSRLLNNTQEQFDRIKGRGSRLSSNTNPAFNNPFVNTLSEETDFLLENLTEDISYIEERLEDELVGDDEKKILNERIKNLKAIQENVQSVLWNQQKQNKKIFGGNTLIDGIAIGDVVVKRRAMNVEEMLTSEFLVNYMNALNATNSEDYTPIMLTVNSDKPTIHDPMVLGRFIRTMSDMPTAKYVIVNHMFDSYNKLIGNIENTFGYIANIISRLMANDRSVRDIMFENNVLLTDYELKLLEAFIETYKKRKNEDSRLANLLDRRSVREDFKAFNEHIDYMNLAENFAGIHRVKGKDILNILGKVANVLSNGRKKLIDQTYFIGKDKYVHNNPLIMGRYAMSAKASGVPIDRVVTQFGASVIDSEKPTTVPDFDKYIDVKNEQMVFYMLKNSLRLNTTNEYGESVFTFPDDHYVREWARNGNLVLIKIGEGNNAVNISSANDIRVYMASVRNNITDSEVNAVMANKDSFNNFITALRNHGIKVTINPLLESYNTTQSFLAQEYMEATVGGIYNHPVKGKPKDLFEYEASAFNAAQKRNVSYTASVQPYMLNTLDGISAERGVAFVNDMEFNVSSFSGNTSSVKSYDGGAYMSITETRLASNSLPAGVTGYDQKPFIHYYDVDTQTGGIIKCAAFGLTNQTIRTMECGDILAYKTSGARWKDNEGRPIDGNIFTDYTFRHLDDSIDDTFDMFEYINNKYDGVYFRGNGGNIYRITRIERNGDGTYTRFVEQVFDSSGVDLTGEEIELGPVSITSNYELWKALGGEESMQYDPESDSYIHSENSISMLVDIMNSVGIVYNPTKREVTSQDDVYQFMKHGNADWIVTEGAIKQGISNVNRYQDMFFNRKGLPSTVRINFRNGGVQLDAGHKADNANVSELTQVMSALSSNGFSIDKTMAIYNAVASVTLASVNSIVKEVTGSGIESEYAQRRITDIASTIIIQSMIDKDTFDDNVRDACRSLIDKRKKGGIITYDELRNTINMSDSGFISQSIPIIASYINSISIKKKYSGIMSILKPSQGIVKLYGGFKWGELGATLEEKIQKIREIESGFNDIPIGEVEMGHNYKISRIDNEGNIIDEEYFRLNDYDDYIGLKDLAEYFSEPNKDGNATTYSIREYIMRPWDKSYDDRLDFVEPSFIDEDEQPMIIDGRDLAPINYHFDVNGARINMYDLDCITALFSARYMTNGDNMEGKPLTNEDAASVFELVIANNEDMEGIINDWLRDKYGGDYYYDNINSILTALMEYNTELSARNNAYREGRRTVADDIREYGIIRVLHSLFQNQTAVLNRSMEGFPMRQNDGIWIGGYKVAVSNVVCKPYECIAPNVNHSKMGFNADTEMSEISPKFFAKRFISNYFSTLGRDKYTYAFMNLNGRHVYVYDEAISGDFDWNGVKELEIKEPNFIYEDGINYRVNKNGEKLYRVDRGLRVARVNDNGRSYDIVVVSQDANSKNFLSSIRSGELILSPSVDSESKVRLLRDTLHSAIAVYDRDTKKYLEGNRYISKLFSTNKATGESFFVELVMDAMEERKSPHTPSATASPTMSRLMGVVEKEGVDGLLAIVNSENESEYIKRFARRVYSSAMRKYQSFLKSNDLLAARIPSQTQQSFMPMRNVAYENSGLNGAYVNNMQIWLQGSDYDIDKVTMQEYALDDNGEFIGWSPFFNNEDIDSSFKLPFPNGSSISEEDIRGKDWDAYMERLGERYAGMYKEQFDKVFVLTENKEGNSSYKLSNSYDVNALAFLISLSNRFGGIVTPNKGESISMMREVIDVINQHNAYFNTTDEMKLDGLKNFITKNSIDVGMDPRNLWEAQSSVDNAPDVKRAASIDKAGSERQKDAYWNAVTFFMSFFDNHMGKDCVGIVAAGLKSFYSITQYYNSLMVDGVTSMESMGDVASRLMLNGGKGVEVFGKIYDHVANLNINSATTNIIKGYLNATGDVKYDEKDEIAMRILALQRIINNEIQEDTASLILSALLTESTDNAKNLNLAKLNATKSTMPMYIFAVTIGMKIDDVTRAMTSPTARIIDRMMNGNMFYDSGSSMDMKDIYKNTFLFNDKGKQFRDIIGIAGNNLLERYPLLKEMVDGGFKLIPVDGGSGPYTYAYGVSQDKPKNADNKHAVIDIVKYMQLLRARNEEIIRLLNNSDSVKNDTVLRASAFLRRLEDEYYDHYVMNNDFVKDSEGNVLINEPYILGLMKLREGSDEMRNLSLMVGLNKGVKQTREDVITWMDNIRNLVSYTNYAKLDNKESNKSNKLEERLDKLESSIISSGLDNPFMYNKFGEKIRKSINFHLFVTDEGYRNSISKIYNDFKMVAFPVFDIAWGNTHTRSYMKVADIAYAITTKGISNKNDAISQYSERALLEMRGEKMTSSEKNEVIRNVGMYVESELLSSFLKDNKIKVTLPPGSTIYEYKETKNGIKNEQANTLEASKLKAKKDIYLGSPEANMAFLDYMNDTVIPNLKLGILSDDKRVKTSGINNSFVDALIQTEYNLTLSGKQIKVYTIPVDSNSNDPIDIATKEEYKASARLLNRLNYRMRGGGLMRLSDMFFLYNALSFYGRRSKEQMDTYLNGISPLGNSYGDYVKDVCENGNIIPLLYVPEGETEKNNFYPILAPKKRRSSTKMKYVKSVDPESMEVGYYVRKPKQNNFQPNPMRNQQFDEDMDENIGDVEFMESYDNIEEDYGGEEFMDTSERSAERVNKIKEKEDNAPYILVTTPTFNQPGLTLGANFNMNHINTSQIDVSGRDGERSTRVNKLIPSVESVVNEGITSDIFNVNTSDGAFSYEIGTDGSFTVSPGINMTEENKAMVGVEADNYRRAREDYKKAVLQVRDAYKNYSSDNNIKNAMDNLRKVHMNFAEISYKIATFINNILTQRNCM